MFKNEEKLVMISGMRNNKAVTYRITEEDENHLIFGYLKFETDYLSGLEVKKVMINCEDEYSEYFSYFYDEYTQTIVIVEGEFCQVEDLHLIVKEDTLNASQSLIDYFYEHVGYVDDVDETDICLTLNVGLNFDMEIVDEDVDSIITFPEITLMVERGNESTFEAVDNIHMELVDEVTKYLMMGDYYSNDLLTCDPFDLISSNNTLFTGRYYPLLMELCSQEQKELLCRK